MNHFRTLSLSILIFCCSPHLFGRMPDDQPIQAQPNNGAVQEQVRFAINQHLNAAGRALRAYERPPTFAERARIFQPFQNAAVQEVTQILAQANLTEDQEAQILQSIPGMMSQDIDDIAEQTIDQINASNTTQNNNQ